MIAIIDIPVKANHKSVARAGWITSIVGDLIMYAATKATIIQPKLTNSHIMPCLKSLLNSRLLKYSNVADINIKPKNT